MGDKQRFVLGDIVLTPDGWGRVVEVEALVAAVWVFGEETLGHYPNERLHRANDRTPTRYGIGIVQRQAAMLRDLQASHDFQQAQARALQAKLSQLEALVQDLATELATVKKGGE